MKRIVSIGLAALLILVMSLSTAACGAKEPSPTEVLDTYLKTIQTEGFDQAGISSSDLDMDDLSESDSDLVDSLKGKMQEFEYELSNEQIDGDSATVDLKVNTYGFGAMLTEVLTEYFQQAITMSYSGAGGEELEAFLNNLFREKVDNLEKTFEKTVTVELVKGEEGWEVKDKTGTNPMFDALLGGMFSSIESMNTMLGEATGE